MDNFKKNTDQESHVKDAAAELINEGRKFANELYEDSINKVNEAENQVKQYSDDLLKKIQENPLASVLIAGGVGYLLAKIMKK